MVDKDKELPDAPIVLTPLRKHARSPFFNRSRWTSTELSFTEQPAARPSEGLVRWIFTVPALIIMFLTFAMATILLLYLTAIRHVPNPTGGFDRSAIFVSGPASNVLLGLTITTVSTHLVSISAPFLLSVSGYCVAGKWLQEQEFPRQTRVPLPTPLQYGFMVKMLTTSNISSVWQAGRYLRESKRRIRFPRAFYLAFVLTSVVLGLSYSLILADIWLHGSTFMVEGITTATAQDASLGVAFNNSICAGSLACLTDKGSWASQREVIQTGLLIAANSSDTLSVITLSNASDLAISCPKIGRPILNIPSAVLRNQGPVYQ
ncbi:hypothetical protein B0H11DRAFT_2233113 [Mycena galericulata]|nr:hypothetical protein B0H11DRAFT_2233113 [Mycena galericulata]